MKNKKGFKKLDYVLKAFLTNKINEKTFHILYKKYWNKYNLRLETGEYTQPFQLNYLFLEPLEIQLKKYEGCSIDYIKECNEANLIKVYKNNNPYNVLYFRLPSLFFKLKIHEYTFHYLHEKITVKRNNKVLYSFENKNIQGYCDFQNNCYQEYFKNLEKQ